MIIKIIKKYVILFGGLVPQIIVAIYILLFFRHAFLSDYVLLILALSLILFILGLFLNNKSGRILRNIVLVVNITYCLLEVTTYFLYSFGVIRSDTDFFFNSFNGTNKKVAVYDNTTGYKAVPGQRRIVCISNGKLQYDNLTRANMQGWFSERDYTFKKKKQGVKRYMILGDSFSSGVVVETPWPDLVQRILLAHGNDSVELYNFSLDGIGIENWYRIFSIDILNKYEFDGIILAAGSEIDGVPDFDRKFFMANSFDNATCIQNMDIMEKLPPDSFPRQLGVQMAGIYTDLELNKIKSSYTERQTIKYQYHKPDLCFVRTFFNVTGGFHKVMGLFNYYQPFKGYDSLVKVPYKMDYFDKRYKYGVLLKKMITYCKSNNKDFVLVTIPDYEHGLQYVSGHDFIYASEHRFLSRFYKIKYFDGFEMFKGKDTGFVKQCFYEYDMHWNKIGVQAFSEKFVESGIL